VRHRLGQLLAAGLPAGGGVSKGEREKANREARLGVQANDAPSRGAERGASVPFWPLLSPPPFPSASNTPLVSASVQAPWGGVKNSGFGRDLGEWGLDNYLSVKQVSKMMTDHCSLLSSPHAGTGRDSTQPLTPSCASPIIPDLCCASLCCCVGNQVCQPRHLGVVPSGPQQALSLWACLWKETRVVRLKES
jgi:hypothetical protein